MHYSLSSCRHFGQVWLSDTHLELSRPISFLQITKVVSSEFQNQSEDAETARGGSFSSNDRITIPACVHY